MPATRKAEGAPSSSSNVVNGINLGDLFALIQIVKQEPAKAMTNWRVRTTWQAHSRSQVEAFGIGGQNVLRRFSIDIDEPCELGGGNEFANPQEHLLAALNACMTVGYVARCAVRGITIEKLEIETEGEIDLRGFLGIDPAVPPGSRRRTVPGRLHFGAGGSSEQFGKTRQAPNRTFHFIV